MSGNVHFAHCCISDLLREFHFEGWGMSDDAMAAARPYAAKGGAALADSGLPYCSAGSSEEPPLI